MILFPCGVGRCYTNTASSHAYMKRAARIEKLKISYKTKKIELGPIHKLKIIKRAMSAM
jgi:hypothetical protein